MDHAAFDRLRFTLHASGIAHYPPGTSFGPRHLTDFEFVWIIAGQVVWTVDGRALPAVPGTVLLARPGMVDHFRWDPRHTTRHGFFHFGITGAGPGLASPWPLLRELPEQDILRPLFQHLGWLQDREDAAGQEQMQAVLRLALAAFVNGQLGTAPEVDPVEPPAIRRVFALVHESWSGGDPIPLTLGDLVRVSGVSKVHLTRLFQTRFGVAPMAALRLTRLDRATSLLARTDLPVQEVARCTGFPDAFHFSRTFRTAFGCSPRDYRQKALAGERVPMTPLVLTRALAAAALRTPLARSSGDPRDGGA